MSKWNEKRVIRRERVEKRRELLLSERRSEALGELEQERGVFGERIEEEKRRPTIKELAGRTEKKREEERERREEGERRKREKMQERAEWKRHYTKRTRKGQIPLDLRIKHTFNKITKRDNRQ